MQMQIPSAETRAPVPQHNETSRNERVTRSANGSEYFDVPTEECVMPDPSTVTAPVRSYRDLRVWQQSMDLAEETYRATEQFPKHERYGLVSQLRRAAVSVASNIAEGHSRSRGDYIRHLFISSGSLSEMETQLALGARLGFLSREQAERLLEVCDQVGRMLGGLRKRLRARPRAPSP